VSQTPGKLERRARALLRAYPADYRHGRAEEIIGTLLEAAPPGRSFPTAREAWSLIAGGRHARAARNRRPGVKANLRLALLLGISTYMGWNASEYWMDFFPGGRVSWLANATGALCLALALAPWLGSRAAAALAIPAGALVAYGELRETHGSTAVAWLAEFLIVVAALAALSWGPVRLPRSWLWLPCAFPLALVAGRLLPPPSPRLESFLVLSPLLLLGPLLLLAVVVVCWLVTDARPAFALCLAVLLGAVVPTLPFLVYDGSLRIALVMALLPYVAIVLPVLLPAAWLLLRRQKAPSRRPFPEP
jgi:hypothetical protein